MTTTTGRPRTGTSGPQPVLSPGTIVLVIVLIGILGWWLWTVVQSPPLEDGEHFALVNAFTEDTIALDPASFLSGDEAIAAARDDGVIGPDEDLPNPFYIRNVKVDEFELDVSSGFEAVLIDATTLGPAPAIDASTFETLMAGGADVGDYYGLTPTDFPMTVTVEDGEVVSAVQHYVP